MYPGNEAKAATSTPGLTASETSESSKTSMKPSNKDFPETTSQNIGWKSSKPSAITYGILETRARGKRDFYKVLDWPQGSS